MPIHADTEPTTAGTVPLAHWGLISARGTDAATFLHSQMTSDFSSLGASDLRLAGFCSAKGRLQASFMAWKAGPDEVLLTCHESVLQATLKRLRMFVLRAKCVLTDASEALPCVGLMGDAAQRALAAADLSDGIGWQQRGIAGGSLLRLPPVGAVARAVWVAPPGSSVPGVEDAAAPVVVSADEAMARWCWLEVCSGVPVIEAGTVDRFVPQMLNYELIGGVDFQKGCYPGQEVVARSQYRGTTKRRMFLFEVGAICEPGQEIFHDSDPSQPAGMVVNAATRPGGNGDAALAEVKLAVLTEGCLHLGTVDGPLLHRQPLPYPVPAPEAADDA